MNYLVYGISYLFNYWVKGQYTPLTCGLVLHNKCNLRCLHCDVINRETSAMTYKECINVIDDFYDRGGRCVYFEGGEPMLWKDNNYQLEDLVSYAKEKGYFSTIIYTNGTQKLKSEASTIFVSIDGITHTHEHIRGECYNQIIANIKSSSHPSIFINYTINTINYQDIKPFLDYSKQIQNIRGVFFYFHTPYYGYDDLFIDKERKGRIINELILLKQKYSILNSKAGLSSSLKDSWKKENSICQVYEDGQYYNCCRDNNNGKTCQDCGYLSYAEVDQTLKLKPSAIINALHYF